MRIVSAFTLVLACVLAACGGEPPRGPELPPAEDEGLPAVLLLDPAGRLLDTAKAPEMYLLREGKVTELGSVGWNEGPLHYFTHIQLPGSGPFQFAEGDELLVLAQGCLPARAPMQSGRNVVRLEAGFRVRVTFDGERPELPPGATLGIMFEHHAEEAGGVTLPTPQTLTTIEAAAFDVDAPTHSQFMHLPPEGVLDVLVPVAGTYRLRFDLRHGNGSYNTSHPDSPFDLRPETGSLDLAWPKAEIENLQAFWKKKR